MKYNAKLLLALFLVFLVSIPLAHAQGPDDKDGDGVPDIRDRCPDIPGPADNNGCPYPDGDGDGVPDHLDQCPNEQGPDFNHGCPFLDRDGDGVADSGDNCPDTPGAADYFGCPWPDSDGDGLTDNQDACPNTAGPPENSGCPYPDGDGDGVPDHLDRCPNVRGSAQNNGCPLITATPTPPLVVTFPPDGISRPCWLTPIGDLTLDVFLRPRLDVTLPLRLEPNIAYLLLDYIEIDYFPWYGVGTGWVSGDKIRLGGRCGSLTFPRPDLETGQPGEPLPDETWQAVEIKPRMCPDWFLYHSNFEGTWNVYLNRNDEAINISQGDNSQNIQPSYSDDAEWVAFTSDREISGNWEIYVTQPTLSAAPIRLTFNTGLDINPAWGPGNRGLIFETNRDAIWKLYHFDIAAAGSANALATPLTDGAGNDVNAYWSPDGSHIYFQSDRDGDWEIFALDMDSRELSQLTENTVADLDPVISHNGAFMAWRQENSEGIFDLWLMDLATGESRQLTHTDFDIVGPQFASSDTFIAFHMRNEGNLDIFAIDLNDPDATPQQVTHNQTVNDVAASFRCDRDTILYHANLDGQNDLFEINPLPLGDIAEPVRLTNTDDADEIYVLDSPRIENNSREGRLPQSR